ncbi:hypothetical protein LDENG_00079160 [Lucifuga dentata]|nr:hypothetical protein LDENG_00079160 [Lucifuga dentata]
MELHGRRCSSSSEDVSQRREVQTAKLNTLPPGISDNMAAVYPHSQETSCSSCDQPGPRRHARRCTCYSYKDKECVYYCHLDIIWINTPDYQGSLRMRRSAGTEWGGRGEENQRCICMLQTDSECSRFCMDRQKRHPELTSNTT